MKDDKGGEFISNALKQLCEEFGIQCQHTVQAEPHQNGVAEHANCNISDHVTAMLHESNLPPSTWPYAVDTFDYLHNCAPCSVNPDSAVPYPSWNDGRIPNV